MKKDTIHYQESKLNYEKAKIKGESHLEYYRNKYPDRYLALINEIRNKQS